MATSEQQKKALIVLCCVLWGLLVFAAVHDYRTTVKYNELVIGFNEECRTKQPYIDAVDVGVIDEGWYEYNQTV